MPDLMVRLLSIAGTHTTSATTSLLLYHLLHNPGTMERCVAEVDANLLPLGVGEEAYSVTVAEASLPYLKNCVKENFRVTPVFTMPLARRVMSSEGTVIAGQHIPQGVSTYDPSSSGITAAPKTLSKRSIDLVANIASLLDIRCGLQSCVSPQSRCLGPGSQRL